MNREGPLVPEERSRLAERHTLVDRALRDEVVEDFFSLRTEIAHAVTRDCQEVALDLLHSTSEVVVLLLFSFCRS